MEAWNSPVNFFVVSLLFLLPYLFFFRHSLFPTTPKLPQPRTLLRPFLTFLVILHTLYTLRLLLSPPINLFTLLNLPLTAPVSAIRVALLERQRDQYLVGFQNNIAPDVEVLLSRLASFEARVIYVRYGPYPLSHCAPCVHLSDFALFALAPTVLPYLRALILVSLITARAASRPAWRTPACIVLTGAFFAEMWWTLDGTVQFRDGKLDGWTHTHTYIARHTLLLFVPLLVHHLPEYSSPSALPPFFTRAPSRPSFPHQASDFRLLNGGPVPQTPRRADPLSRSYSTPTMQRAGPSGSTPDTSVPGRPSTPVTTLTGTLSSLSTTISTLRVLEWARMAGLRRTGLREQMSSYYATEQLDATYARSDDRLRREAERLGLAYGRESSSFALSSRARPTFDGSNSTWRGNGDPRGLDNDSVIEDDEEEDDEDARRAERRRERERLAEEAEMAKSPLRAKARKAARELVQTFLTGDRRASV